MKCKLLLSFYFRKNRLLSIIDKKIECLQLKAMRAPLTDELMINVLNLAFERVKLNELWNLLDNALKVLTLDDRWWLNTYARLRVGVSTLQDEDRAAIRRAVKKFYRSLKRYSCALKTYLPIFEEYAAFA